MQVKAAVLRSSPGQIEIVTADLDAPRAGEIQVKMAAAGLCHSDYHLVVGDTHANRYPMVLGHEGAGVVTKIGPNTPNWEVGDHVVFAFVPSCGRCRWCAEGMANLCNLGAHLFRGSRFDDTDSFRFGLDDGSFAGQLCGLGTFSEYTTVSANSAIKIDKDLPFDVACLLGCGVGTGWGSAVYAAEAKPGDVVIVMGVGGVGINAVQGAAHAGATAVIAVDPVKFKRDIALTMGATHAFDSIHEAAEFSRSITDGQGADSAVVAVDVLTGSHIAEAVAAIRKAGTVVLTAVASDSFEGGIPVHPREFQGMQKRLIGALYGQCSPASDIPRQIRMYRAGQLKLDQLVTQRYALDNIDDAFDDMLKGRNIRGVITFD